LDIPPEVELTIFFERLVLLVAAVFLGAVSFLGVADFFGGGDGETVHLIYD
jgi:hypothetical protein